MSANARIPLADARVVVAAVDSLAARTDSNAQPGELNLARPLAEPAP